MISITTIKEIFLEKTVTIYGHFNGKENKRLAQGILSEINEAGNLVVVFHSTISHVLEGNTTKLYKTTTTVVIDISEVAIIENDTVHTIDQDQL